MPDSFLFLSSHSTPIRLLVLGMGLALATGACRQEFTLDANVPEAPAELVVNGFFSPDSLFEVYVNTSTPLLGSAKPAGLTQARVEIMEDGRLLEVLAFDGVYSVNGSFVFEPDDFDQRTISRYRSKQFYPEAGKRYTIRVSADGFETVMGSDVVPEPVPIQEATYSPGVTPGPAGAMGQIRLVFDDPGGEANYYYLRHHYRAVDTTTQAIVGYGSDFTVLTDLQDEFFGADPDDLFGLENDYIHTRNGISFSDALFDGQRKEIVLEVFDDFFCESPRGFDVAYSCQQVVELSAVSESFYRYHRTLQLQNASLQNPFAEPVRILSNMSNEMGVFAGHNRDFWIYTQPSGAF